MNFRYLFFFFLFTTPLVGQNDLLIADSLYSKASEMNRAVKYDLALTYATQAQAIYLKYEKWERYYLTKQMELDFNVNLMNYAVAKRVYEEIMEKIVERLGPNSLQEAVSHGSAGNLFSDGDQDYEKAYRYYTKALGMLLSQDSLNVNALNITYGQLTVNRSTLGLMDDAIEYGKTAIDVIQRELPASVTRDEYLSFHYRTIGDCYMDKGAFQESLAYNKKALALYKKVYGKTHLRTGIVYHGLADISRELHQSKEALNYNHKALDIFLEHLGAKHLYVALTYNNMGNVFLLQKDYEKSAIYFQKTIEIAEQLGDEGMDYLPIAYVNLGLVSNQLKNYKKAEKYIQKALKMDINVLGRHHVEVAEDYNYLTMCYQSQEKWEQALTANLAAILANTTNYETRDPYAFAEVLENATFFTNPYLTVEIFTYKAFLLQSIYEETGDLELLKHALTGIMKLLTFIDKTKQQFFVIEDEIDFSSEVNSVYELGILIAGELYKVTKDKSYLKSAFVLAEKNKSEALGNVLQSNSAIKIGNVPDSLQQQEKLLKENIAEVEYYLIEAQMARNLTEVKQLEAELFELKRKLEKLIEAIETNYPAYYELKYAMDWMKVSEVQSNLLGAKDMLLEYFVGDSVVYLFAVTANDINFYPLGTKKDMRRTIRQLRESLTNLKQLSQQPRISFEQFCHHAHDFYQHLVEPAIKGKDIEQLIVIPDDYLNFIPFEALLTAPTGQSSHGQDYKKLAYLLTDYQVNYSYSARLLRANKGKETAVNQQILAFAASYDYTGTGTTRSQLNPLPSVIKEVKGLEGKFDGYYLYQKEANEEAFKTLVARYSIIHLAMHGLLNSKHPELSCLAFSLGSDSTKYDDFLYAHEIANLKMNADLVVLSACETGYGKFEGGEGVMSLARSFMYAGIPSLVVSLWQVNDNATAIIMESLYQSIAQGMTKAAALRQAKLDYLTQKSGGIASHPNFWAAFIHLGKDGSIELQPKQEQKISIWGGILAGGFLLGLLIFFVKKKKQEKTFI